MKTKTSPKEAVFRKAFFVILLLILLPAFWKTFQPSPTAPIAPVPAQWGSFGKIPDFSLTERSGKKITASDLAGRVWIADFIFTRCAGPCPLMSNRMKEIQKQLAGEPDVRLVSFSVDPGHDTPKVLKKYAERYEADRDRWLFLTGDQSQIYRLAEQHFHLGVEEIPVEERQAADQPVRHSTKFVLVDKQGRVRGYYDSENPQSTEQLIKDVKQLSS